MYSYQDRVRAVKLYILRNERTTVTIRQLGYARAILTFPVSRIRGWQTEASKYTPMPSKFLARREKNEFCFEMPRVPVCKPIFGTTASKVHETAGYGNAVVDLVAIDDERHLGKNTSALQENTAAIFYTGKL